jgi:hypothetical protein
MPVIPAIAESINRKIVVQSSLGKKQDPNSKIAKAKRARGITKAIKCLFIKHKALSSTSILPPPKKGNEK